MRYRELGRSGISASVVAFGAWAIGGWNWGGTEDDKGIRAIHAALDGGINFIDTAPMYGMGHSEEVVGRALRGRRDKVVLATKCGMVWDGTERGDFRFATDEHGVREDGPIKVYKYLGRGLHPAGSRNQSEATGDRLYRPVSDALAGFHNAGF